MSGKAKTVVGLLVFVLLICVAAVSYNMLKGKTPPQSNIDTAANQQSAPGAAGEPNGRTKAPDFTVADGAGKSVKLSDMAGKPIVINFWASWCSPCKAELPDFQKAYEEYGGSVTFMMVDLTDGQRETKNIGAQYVAGQGFTFPLYFDLNGDASNKYVRQYIPMTYFIDKNGYIVTSNEGAIPNYQSLVKGINLIK